MLLLSVCRIYYMFTWYKVRHDVAENVDHLAGAPHDNDNNIRCDLNCITHDWCAHPLLCWIIISKLAVWFRICCCVVTLLIAFHSIVEMIATYSLSALSADNTISKINYLVWRRPIHASNDTSLIEMNEFGMNGMRFRILHWQFTSTNLQLTNVFHCRDFLPRGSGIVTRRPLILQLMNSNAGE